MCVGGGGGGNQSFNFHNLNQMIAFAENPFDCRRTMQLKYFGENYRGCRSTRSNKLCDNCTKNLQFTTHNLTEEAKTLMKNLQYNT